MTYRQGRRAVNGKPHKKSTHGSIASTLSRKYQIGCRLFGSHEGFSYFLFSSYRAVKDKSARVTGLICCGSKDLRGSRGVIKINVALINEIEICLALEFRPVFFVALLAARLLSFTVTETEKRAEKQRNSRMCLCSSLFLLFMKTLESHFDASCDSTGFTEDDDDD